MTSPLYWVDPTAKVETQQIGEGTKIWAFSHIQRGVHIGAECNIGDHVFIETGVVVGDRVTIKNGVALWDGIVLEDDVFVGPNSVFTNDRFPRSPRSIAAGDRYKTKGWLEKTTVRQGASIGANATVLCGIEIGEYATIGAGAVVTRSVQRQTLIVGNPGRVRGLICLCGRGLTSQNGVFLCNACGRRYAP